MTNTLSFEEQVSNISKMMETMMKHIKDQDALIAQLLTQKNHAPEGSHMKFKEHQEHEILSSKSKDKMKEVYVTAERTIPVEQLKKLVEDVIKEKKEGNSKSSFTYSKPYTARIDSLAMRVGYQPPKFQQFDGKGSPKQHVAYFIETCNNAGTYSNLLVKQFIRSLKSNAFDWYTDLTPGSIDNWEQLEQEFLNHFYSTGRTISMLELTNTRQWKDEPVVNYIDRWRSLSLN
nr:uncharacterized protein LOC113735812 [Coffea arabica]